MERTAGDHMKRVTWCCGLRRRRRRRILRLPKQCSGRGWLSTIRASTLMSWLCQSAPWLRFLITILFSITYFRYSKANVMEKRIVRSEEHTSELQSLAYLVCRLLLEKKKQRKNLVMITSRLSEHTPSLQ